MKHAHKIPTRRSRNTRRQFQAWQRNHRPPGRRQYRERPILEGALWVLTAVCAITFGLVTVAGLL